MGCGGYLESGILAPLCGYHHNSVAAFHAVEGCSRGILEHGHGLDFETGNVVKVAREAVHQKERAVAVEAQRKLQAGLVGVVSTGGVPDQKAGELSVQCICNIYFRTLVKDGTLQRFVHVCLELEGVPHGYGIQHGTLLRHGCGACKKKRKDYTVYYLFHLRVHLAVYQPGF